MFAIGSVVLSIVIPLGMFFSLESRTLTLEILAGVFLTAYAGLFLARAISEKELNLYQFFFWSFVYIWMALSPTVQIYAGFFPSTTPGVNKDFVIYSLAVTFVGLLAFQFGLRPNTKRQAPQNQTQGSLSRVNHVSLYSGNGLSYIPAIAIGITSFGAFFVYLGQVGVESLFKFRNEKFQYLSSVIEDSVSVSILYSTTWTFSLIAGLYFVVKAKILKSRNFWLLGVLFSLPALIVANPISTGRYVSGCVYGSLAIVSLYKNSALGNRLLKIGLLSGVLLVFPILNVFRSQDARLNRSSFYLDFLSGDYDAFAQLVNAAEYKDQIGSLFTNQFLGPLLFFVPRQSWAEKPLDTGILLANFKGYSFSNLSAPLWAEFLISFSIGGLLVLFLMLGKIIGQLDSSFQLKGLSMSPMFIPGAIYSLILLRGSLLQAFGAFALMLAVSIVLKLTEPKDSLDEDNISFGEIRPKSHSSSLSE